MFINLFFILVNYQMIKYIIHLLVLLTIKELMIRSHKDEKINIFFESS